MPTLGNIASLPVRLIGPLVVFAVLYLGRGSFVEALAAFALCLAAGVLLLQSLYHMSVVKTFFANTWGLDSTRLQNLRSINGSLFLNNRTFIYTMACSPLLFYGVPYVVVAFFLEMNLWAIPLFLAARLWWLACRQLCPPVAIFLSASQSDAIRLIGDVQRRIFPLRIVNLLDVDAADDVRRGYLGQGARKVSEANLVRLDGYRLSRTEGWQETVEKLLVHAPLIIIDLRAASTQLEAEIDMIARRLLYWKLVVVRPSDHPNVTLGHSPFRQLGEHRGEVSWLTPEELPKTIVHSIVLAQRLPDKDCPAGQLLVPPAHDYKEWNYLHPDMSR